jgi:hypothetical protein
LEKNDVWGTYVWETYALEKNDVWGTYDVSET